MLPVRSRAKSFLLSTGLKISKGDRLIFHSHQNNKLIGLIAIFADDFPWPGINDLEANVPNCIKLLLLVKKKHSVFQYLGLNLGVHDFEIALDQQKYAQSLKPTNSNDTYSKELLQSHIRKLL